MSAPLEHDARAFVPARGLRSAHAQTLFAYARRLGGGPHLERERWETSDGDFVDVDFLPAPAEAPHLVVLHGLEGSSRAGYVRSMLEEAQLRGWGAAALNFRSCSGEQNRLPRSYHSGETLDAELVVTRLGERVRGPLLGVGFSLGANVLLRMLERLGDATPLLAAAAVSAPYDLRGCARTLDAGTGALALYRTVFLRTLRRKALEKGARFGAIADLERVRGASGIEAFDDAFTAPVHGFKDASDYYAQSSAGPHLAEIRRPTLLLSSLDDPMIPPSAGIPPEADALPLLTVLRLAHGGHCGFVSGTPLRPHFWAEAEVARYFDSVLRARG